MKDFTLRPVAVFHSLALNPYDVPRQAEDELALTRGKIEFFEKSNFEQALDDIEGFDRLWLIYVFHKNGHWKPKVRPPRGSSRKKGVFSTRAPYRPNPLGLSCVRLVKRDKLVLWIAGSDLLNETPILDVKPYLPYADAFPEAFAGWAQDIGKDRLAVTWSPLAEKQAQWLNEHSVGHLTDFTKRQLEFEPFDSQQKRVRKVGENQGELSYRTWRIFFRYESESRTIEIQRIETGYSKTEIDDPADPYADKPVHDAFDKMF